MAAAFLWGALGGAALLIGAAVALLFRVGQRPLGAVMAFGSGVLISAVAYDLVLEAADTTDGEPVVTFGLLAGALVFFAGDTLIDRLGGGDRKSTTGKQSSGSGMAIVLGSVLDGIPESIVLGLGLIGGGGISVAFIAAVFISNLPEGLAATTGLVSSGWRTGRIVLLWSAVLLVSALSSLAGYALFDQASDTVIAFVLAFAGGAILTMLADSMMPEAFQLEGKLAGLFTAIGFAIAFALHLLG